MWLLGCHRSISREKEALTLSLCGCACRGVGRRRRRRISECSFFFLSSLLLFSSFLLLLFLFSCFFSISLYPASPSSSRIASTSSPLESSLLSLTLVLLSTNFPYFDSLRARPFFFSTSALTFFSFSPLSLPLQNYTTMTTSAAAASTTSIRAKIAGGPVPESPFPIKMSGTVIKGFGRGSKELGIPTGKPWHSFFLPAPCYLCLL